MDKLGQSIQIATIFFILSLVSERFITWFKLYFFKKGNTLFWYFFNWEKDYSVKTDDPVFEKEREQRILLLNISLNIIIAFLIHANIFTILHDDPLKYLSWKDITDNKETKTLSSFYEISGCIFGGLLISLGSKFWHDTLDMLFYTKNLKEKLGDKETYKIETLKELDEWIAITEADIVKKVFEENRDILKNIPDVISVGIGHNNNSKYIEVVTTNNPHLIPNSLPYYLPNNTVRKVDIKVVVSSPISTFSNSIKSGSDIANNKTKDNFGTLGLVVKAKNGKSKNMVLTCYHVVIDENHNYQEFDYQIAGEIIHPHGDEGVVIGKLNFGIRNNEIDAALISIDPNITTSNVNEFGEISTIRTIAYEERYSNIKVMVNGYNKRSNSKKGIVRSLYNSATINYKISNNKKEPWELNNLIAISDEEGKSITFGGDSGAAVLDEQNRVIGIVVGGNSELTYAIPIATIFNQLNITLS
ncbi:Trypsin-like peptidase domain-containing protein [Flavobacterium sp. CF108]|nr:Trypsin-like peptidase domain-containing protein [Flavobacterium sp. fv08]SHI01499.1 Trypsin-like peptidase domain-containing protein [Flavobacterium sp. CF108]